MKMNIHTIHEDEHTHTTHEDEHTYTIHEDECYIQYMKMNITHIT